VNESMGTAQDVEAGLSIKDPSPQASSTRMPRTLLIVASKPGDGDVGEILVKEMLAQLPEEAVYLASVLPHPPAEFSTNTDSGLKAQIFRHADVRVERRFSGAIGGLVCAAERAWIENGKISAVSAEIVRFAQRHQVQQIWAIYNTPAVVMITQAVQHALQVPLYSQVWDDIEHICRQMNFDRLSRRRVRTVFSRLLGISERTAVISENMAARYAADYQARCQLVRHGVENQVSPRCQPTSEQEFRIAFSGSMYCPSAWSCFLAAMDVLNWQVGGKSIRFTVFCNHVSLKSARMANIDFRGWRSLEEVSQTLQSSDLLYLPQAFEPEHRPLTELSFPTKLSAYAGAGRPVLVHSPSYGSLNPLFREHAIGVLCNSLSPEELALQIRQFATNSAAYRTAAENMAQLGSGELSRGRFVHQLNDFLRT
jgi:hypothetical protein